MEEFLFWFDLGMAVFMILLALPFLLSKNGKACTLVSGYNMKSPEERAKYDEPKLCRAYGRRIASWSVPFVIGFFIDLARPGLGCLISWVLFCVLLVWHIVDINRNLNKKYLK